MCVACLCVCVRVRTCVCGAHARAQHMALHCTRYLPHAPFVPAAILARATGKDLATCQKEYLNR